MRYVALLRGINVGGNNRVEMARLKTMFEHAGFTGVKTYINSGNVIFNSDIKPDPKEIEEKLQQEFGFEIKTLIRNEENIKQLEKLLPASWINDNTTKCDVMFLWDEVAGEDVLRKLDLKQGIDDVKYVGGAILWRVDRENVTRSGMMKIVGSDLYKKMTIRNCNTLRKIALIMQDA